MHTFYGILHGIALSVNFISSQKGKPQNYRFALLGVQACCSRNLDWILFSDFQNTLTDLVNLIFRKRRHPQEPWRSANDIELGHLLCSQVSAYKNMYIHMYICIYVYMYICIYVYMYICIYVYMYICIYMYTCACKYIYMYICTYLYIDNYVVMLYSLCQKQIDAICRTSRQKERRIESNQCVSIYKLTGGCLKIRRL